MSHNVKLKNLAIGSKYIINCRNPIDRFVSGFYSRKRKGKKGTSDWSKAEKLSFKMFEDANNLAESLSSKNQKIRDDAKFAMN